MKPENKDHFSGATNVIRVQQWRQQNPGYWNRKKSKKTSSLIKCALLETLSMKAIAGKGFSSDLMQWSVKAGKVSERSEFLPVSATEFRGCKKLNRIHRNPYPGRVKAK